MASSWPTRCSGPQSPSSPHPSMQTPSSRAHRHRCLDLHHHRSWLCPRPPPSNPRNSRVARSTSTRAVSSRRRSSAPPRASCVLPTPGPASPLTTTPRPPIQFTHPTYCRRRHIAGHALHKQDRRGHGYRCWHLLHDQLCLHRRLHRPLRLGQGEHRAQEQRLQAGTCTAQPHICTAHA